VSDEGGRSVFDRLRMRGEEVLGQISAELMANPHFMRALEQAMKGKQRLDVAVGRVLKTLNVPTRREFKKAVSRIDALEAEISALRSEIKGARPARARRGKPPAARARPRKS
jgi:polyhydroxyalkanoate synthesis regulator phasin